MNLNSILIGSEDPKRLREYYSKVFGATAFEDGDFAGWQIGNGYVTVGSHDQIKGQNRDPGRVIWNIESSDVKADFEKIQGERGNRGPGALQAGGVDRDAGRDVDRHVLGSRQQLLPAHEHDVIQLVVVGVRW